MVESVHETRQKINCNAKSQLQWSKAEHKVGDHSKSRGYTDIAHLKTMLVDISQAQWRRGSELDL